MRVTDSMTNKMLTGYMLKNRDELYRLQEQTSSGKKISKPSDNPGSYDLIAGMHHQSAMMEQYQTNSTRLEGDLLVIDSKLQYGHDELQRASEIMISGGDGTKNPEDLKALGQELNQILEELVSVANTAPSGSYAFAGLRQSEPAYIVQRDADGLITSISYQGSEETRKVEIAEGEYVPANFVGSDLNGQNGIFQTSDTDVFAHLMHARDRLLASENLAEPEAFSVDPVTDTLTVTDTYATGSTVLLSSSETLPGGLNPDTPYYAIRISDTEIQLASSLENARAGVPIDITDAGTGALEITQTHLADIERDEEQMMEVLTKLGAYEERVAITLRMLQTDMVAINQKLEKEEAVDMAEAIMELTNKQTAYEASLKVTTSTMQSSLLNYI